MPRYTHPDDDTVYACPECDSAPPHRREHKGGRNATEGTGDEVVCYECHWSGSTDDVVSRPPKPGGGQGRPPKAILERLE